MGDWLHEQEKKQEEIVRGWNLQVGDWVGCQWEYGDVWHEVLRAPEQGCLNGWVTVAWRHARHSRASLEMTDMKALHYLTRYRRAGSRDVIFGHCFTKDGLVPRPHDRYPDSDGCIDGYVCTPSQASDWWRERMSTLKITTGDFLKELDRADLLLVTSHSTVARNGKLMMGRGGAQRLKGKLEGKHGAGSIAEGFGARVNQACGSRGEFGVVTLAVERTRTELGLFQTRRYYLETFADPDLVRRSARALKQLVEAHPEKYRRVVLEEPDVAWTVYDQELPAGVLVYRAPR